MKPCDPRWHDVLAEHALGSPASAALTEHLANCAICSATLRDWQERMGKIDAGIRQLAAPEPRVQAASLILARVRIRHQGVWLGRWQWKTATLCGLVAVIALLVHEQKVYERNQARKVLSSAYAISSWKSPTKNLLRSPTDQWLKSPPRLGRYFYQLNTNVTAKETKNP